jgi:DNA-binding GntR family transcriptional regulator
VVNAEFAFHRALNRASGRIKLAWFLLHAARYLPPQIYAGDPQWGHNAVVNRREMIAALRRHDVDTVVRLTDLQFTDGARRLTARLDELGLWT